MKRDHDSSTILGEMLRTWRAIENVGVRDAAADIGISAATLSRIERGHDFDMRTFQRLLAWLLRK